MSLVSTVNDFGRAMRTTRLIIHLLILVVAAGMLAFSAIVNAIDYTKVQARVERVAILCRPSGAPVDQAVDCTTSGPMPTSGKLIRSVAVYLHYTSPADGREHQGRIVPPGTDQMKRARALRPGDLWTIWAHDDEPGTIKIY